MPYNEGLIKVLTDRFEDECRKENVRFSFGPMHDEVCHMAEDNMCSFNHKDAERIERRRRNDFNKRKRMSLLANAVGAKHSLPLNQRRTIMPVIPSSPHAIESANTVIAHDEEIMKTILSFGGEEELRTTMASVSSQWFDWASIAYANLLVRSVNEAEVSITCPPLERSWNSIHEMLPWACFIAEGGAKRVYKAFNSCERRIEAVSVM